jgi:shikimate dehydrogenase
MTSASSSIGWIEPVDINKDTRLVALLGNPLGHSFSPVMQNSAFQEAGLNYIYLPIEVRREDLGDVIKGMAKMRFAGCNVTTPHKVEIMGYLDEIDETAEIIGAVNVITFKEGRIKGYNVDGVGFYRSFEAAAGTSAEGRTLFVLGAGGASRALCATFAMKGAQKIYICNRTQAKADELAAHINRSIRECAVPVARRFDDMRQALEDADAVVNTTSVGMYPHGEDLCMDAGLLDRRHLVCDIVYNPVKTRFLKEAEQLGCKTLGGLAMLANQGAESFRLWTEREAPVERMYQTLAESLGL